MGKYIPGPRGTEAPQTVEVLKEIMAEDAVAMERLAREKRALEVRVAKLEARLLRLRTAK